MKYKQLLSVLFFYLINQAVLAEGPVWKVSNGESHLLIGGTIHMLSENDYPLPSVFNQAYDNAEVLVFEINPDLVSSAEVGEKFLEYALYNDNRTLKDVLSPSTYKMLHLFLEKRGMSVKSFSSMKPSMLSIVLTVAELQRLGLAGVGVDEFFNQRAKRDNKKRQSLETIDDQFNALLSLGIDKEDEVILHALDELENMAREMQKIKQAWRKGDNNELSEVALLPWMDKFPQMYQFLLVQRNQRWLPQLEEFIRTPEIEYILVGALHLAGPDGVLEMLKAKGYSVKKL